MKDRHGTDRHGYDVLKGALKDEEISNLIFIDSSIKNEMMSSCLRLRKKNTQAIYNRKLIRNRIQEMFARAATMIMNPNLQKRASAMRMIKKAHKEVVIAGGIYNV